MALLPYEIVRQNRLMAASPAMSSGVPEDPLARARAEIAAAYERAPQGIDPRMAALLDRRLQRADEQERELQRAQKGTIWEALMRAGTAMASNQSPFFAPALAAGANAALSAVQQRRAEAARARMGLADMRDDVEMQRIQMEGAGRAAAEAEIDRTLGIAGKLSDVDAKVAQARNALMDAQRENDPEMRALKVAQARADLRRAELDAKKTEAETAKIRREAANVGRGGGGTGDTVFDRRYAAILRSKGQAAADEFAATGKFTGSDLTPTQRGQMRQNLVAVESAKKQLETLKTLNPGQMTGFALGRLPGNFSDSANRYDKALANLRAQFRKISRTTGEGAISDYETQLNNATLPDRADTAEGRKQAIADLEAQIQFLEGSYRDILGGNRSGNQGASGGNVVTTPDGKSYTFPNAQAAEQFRRKAGL